MKTHLLKFHVDFNTPHVLFIASNVFRDVRGVNKVRQNQLGLPTVLEDLLFGRIAGLTSLVFRVGSMLIKNSNYAGCMLESLQLKARKMNVIVYDMGCSSRYWFV